MTTATEILNAALVLDQNARAEIAHQLLLSLEPDGLDDDVDQLWADEIRSRRRAIREGSTDLRDWDDALAGMRESLAAEREIQSSRTHKEE